MAPDVHRLVMELEEGVEDRANGARVANAVATLYVLVVDQMEGCLRHFTNEGFNEMRRLMDYLVDREHSVLLGNVCLPLSPELFLIVICLLLGVLSVKQLELLLD